MLRLPKRIRSFSIDIRSLELQRVKYTDEQSEMETSMARKAKPKKQAKAPHKAATAFNEAALTKGELRKLSALKKSVGDQIGEKAFMQWLRNKTKSATAVSSDQNAEMIADTLGKLLKDSGLKLPRGGYLVTRGRGRVIVTRATSGPEG